MKKNERNWLYFGVSAGIVAVTAGLVWWRLPHLHDMVWLALYTIPSHMFVSPFNHEWLLLLLSKSNPALWCTVACLIGCLIAGMWDYWLFFPLIHHPRIRSKYTRAGLYKKSVAFFRKWPFWSLVVIGLTPLPFYPIKFLAIADRYPLKKYLLALIIGRTPRYYGLAYVGHMLRFPTWSLIALALVLLVIGIIENRRSEKNGKEEEQPTDSSAVDETGSDDTADYAASTSSRVSARSTPSGK